MTINDGGPVFPMTVKIGSVEASNGGMSLRDWFAGQALSGFFAYHGAEHMNEATSDTADYCYKMADAMIAARGVK